MGRYLPELDGIRFFAIVPVLMFHLGLPGFSFGWSGVQLFFVLSGYLITGILLDSHDHAFYFRNFYARRALRIFPIYYLLLLGIICGAAWTGASVRDAGWYALYLQNHVLGDTGFQPNFPALYNHTWSLAIEEQFYLLWPIGVRFMPRKALFLTACALLVVGALARIAVFALTGSRSLVFTLLPTEVDALAAGALLALVQRRDHSVLRWFAIVGLATGIIGVGTFVARFGIAAFWAPETWLLSECDTLLWSALIALFTGGLAYVLLRPGGRTAAALRLRPLVHIGRISYGLYLYHFPVFVLLADAQSSGVLPPLPPALLLTLKLAVTYVVALASFRWVESRFLGLKRRFV